MVTKIFKFASFFLTSILVAGLIIAGSFSFPEVAKAECRTYQRQPSQWLNRTAHLALDNQTSSSVQVTLYHPDTQQPNGTWTINPGYSWVPAPDYIIADDWGIQIGNSCIFYVGEVAQYLIGGENIPFYKVILNPNSKIVKGLGTISSSSPSAPITVISSTGRVDSNDTSDIIYSFNTSDGNSRLTLSGLTRNADMRLFRDDNGNGVFDSTEYNLTPRNPNQDRKPDTLYTLTLSPGTYYVEIYTTSDNSGTDYTLHLSSVNTTVVSNAARYEFTYYYGNGDYYSGYGYTTSGNYLYQGLSTVENTANETGYTGYYFINSVDTSKYDSSQAGKVFVTKYYDFETNILAQETEPKNFGSVDHLHEGNVEGKQTSGNVGVGYSGLGSETGLAHYRGHNYTFLNGVHPDYNLTFARFSKFYEADYLDGKVPDNFPYPHRS
jgi:hypothetical protein